MRLHFTTVHCAGSFESKLVALKRYFSVFDNLGILHLPTTKMHKNFKSNMKRNENVKSNYNLNGKFNQGSHGQGKVSEKRKKFKVREKSGNFELSQGNLQFWKKSGKSQGIL